MNITGSMIASIPLWLIALFFLLYLFKPRPEYRSREKFPLHAAMCISLGSVFAALAKVVWDGAATMGGIISIPFWVCAAIFAAAAFGCVLDRRPGETDTDLISQGIIGAVLSGLFAIIAALLVRLL